MSTPYGPDSPSTPRDPFGAAASTAAPRGPAAGTRPTDPIVLAPSVGTVHGGQDAPEGLRETVHGLGARTTGLLGRVVDALRPGRSGRHTERGTPDRPGSSRTDDAAQAAPTRRSRQPGRRRKGRREDVMVPRAEFSSYYGRQIVKPAPWKKEIPAYLYLGGLAAGSALVAAGGEMTGRVELQRNSRLIAIAALGGSTTALVADLGRPSRFLNMMRTMKLTSPMSVGSWILFGFGAFTGVAAVSEVMKQVLPPDVPGAWFWPIGDRLASLGAGAFSAPLAAYTAVLLSDTATPTWHESYRQLPFVFVGSALAAAGGAAMATTSPAQSAPARRMAIGGAVLEYGAYELMERGLGICAEPLHEGRPAALLAAAKACTVGGAALTLLAGRRRPAAVLAGLALNAGSALTRFGVFEAGINSAKDPRYTVVPQRERLARRRADADLATRSDPTTARPG